MKSSRFVIAASFGLAVMSTTASAITIVAPGDLAAVEGNSNNGFPFNTGNMRYQQVFNASHFGGNSGVIDQILFRVNGGDSSFSTVYNIEVRLSNTATSAATLSTTFANNIGADETLVLDNNAYVASGTGGSPGPNPFDIVIDVDDLFTYDGTSNLLMDITIFSGISGSQFDSTDRGVAVDNMQRVWASGAGSSTGLIAGDEGLVTSFVFQDSAAAPVPATIALLGLGLAGLAFSRRKQA